MELHKINEIYRNINSIIKSYLIKWKIEPEKLKWYLNNDNVKMDNFIKKHNLDNNEMIKNIINDIIDDYIFMKRDGLL